MLTTKDLETIRRIIREEIIQAANRQGTTEKDLATPLPETGYVRLPEIIGMPANKKKGLPAEPGLFPVSKTTWWEGVKSGRYPKGVKLSARVTAWRVEDIRALLGSEI